MPSRWVHAARTAASNDWASRPRSFRKKYGTAAPVATSCEIDIATVDDDVAQSPAVAVDSVEGRVALQSTPSPGGAIWIKARRAARP